jgi:hypothetical protein
MQFLDIEAGSVSIDADALVAQNTWLPDTVQVLDFDTNGAVFWESNKLFYFADFELYRVYGITRQINFAVYDVVPNDFTQAKAFDWRNGQLVGFALRTCTSKSTGVEPITQVYSVVANQQSNTISPTVSQLDPQNLPWWSNGQLISVGDLITLRETQLVQWGFGQDLLQSPFVVISPPDGVTLEQITSTTLCRYIAFGSNSSIVAQYWQDNRIATPFTFIYWDLVRIGITLRDPVFELIAQNYTEGIWLKGRLCTSVSLNLFLLTYIPIVWSDQQLAPVQVSDLIDPSYTGGAWANGHLRSDALLDPLSLVLLIYAAVGGTQQLAPVQIYDLIDPNYKEGAWANGHLCTDAISNPVNYALVNYLLTAGDSQQLAPVRFYELIGPSYTADVWLSGHLHTDVIVNMMVVTYVLTTGYFQSALVRQPSITDAYSPALSPTTIAAQYWQNNRITTTFVFIYWDLVRIGTTVQQPKITDAYSPTLPSTTIVAQYWQNNRITATFVFIYWDLVRTGIILNNPTYGLVDSRYTAGVWLNGHLCTSVIVNLAVVIYAPAPEDSQQPLPVQMYDLVGPNYTAGIWVNGHLYTGVRLNLSLLTYSPTLGSAQQLALVQMYDLVDSSYRVGAWLNGHLYTSVRLNLALLIYAPMSLEYGTISSANCHSNWVFSYTLDPQITLPATEISELDDKDDAWCWEANSLIMFWNRLFWPYETGRIQLSTSGLLHRTHVYEDSYVVGSNGAVYDVDYAMIDGNKLTIELPEWAPFEGRYFIVLQLEDALGTGDVYGSSFSFRNVGGLRYWPENARLLLTQNEFVFGNSDITINLPSYLEVELPDPKPLIRDKSTQYMRKVLFYSGSPTYVNLVFGNIPLAASAYARYDDVVFSARVLDPWHDEYQNMPDLCNKIHELNPNTRIWFNFDSSDAVQDKQDFLTKLNYLALTLNAAGVVFNGVPDDILTMAELFRAVHSFKLRVAVSVWNPKTEIFDTPLANEWWAGWDIVVLRSTPFYVSNDELHFPSAWDVFERPSLINYTLADYAIPYWQVTSWTAPNSLTITNSELYEHAYYFALYMAYFQGASGFAFQPPDDYASADWLPPMLPDPLQATNYRTNARFSDRLLSDGTKVYTLSTKLGDLYMRVDTDGRTPLETRFGKYATYYGLTRYEGVDKVAYKGKTRPVKVPGAVLMTPLTDPTLLREPRIMLDTAFAVYPGLAKAINLAALGLNFTARYRNAQVTKLKAGTYQIVATGDGEISASDCEWLIFSSADNTNPAYIWLEF